MIEPFLDRLDMAKLGFVRSESAETGAPRLRPARSTEAVSLSGTCVADPVLAPVENRVPAQCGSDVAARALVPDYKSIAKFRRMHREACSRQLCSYADKGLQITEEFPLLVSSPAQGLVPSF